MPNTQARYNSWRSRICNGTQKSHNPKNERLSIGEMGFFKFGVPFGRGFRLGIRQPLTCAAGQLSCSSEVLVMRQTCGVTGPVAEWARWSSSSIVPELLHTAHTTSLSPSVIQSYLGRECIQSPRGLHAAVRPYPNDKNGTNSGTV